MITPYFNTPARQATLQVIASQWLGTPFMPNAAVKGAGVSCQKLVGAIYIECGFLPAAFLIPEGPMDWGTSHTKSLVGDFMAAQSARFVEVLDARLAAVQPGDMVGFQLGGCIHHCGLVIQGNGDFIHALRRANTSIANVRDATYHARLEKIWRPVSA